MEYVFTLDGTCRDKNELGNKGANLVVMSGLGLPVPPGFVVSISAYKKYQVTGQLPEEEINQAMSNLEAKMGRKMGAGLEVSVRSSAPVSMPGMMDTLLNVGSMEQVKEAINKIFASWDNPRAVNTGV
jgi:pyruvate,orthophosphate dikinase